VPCPGRRTLYRICGRADAGKIRPLLVDTDGETKTLEPRNTVIGLARAAAAFFLPSACLACGGAEERRTPDLMSGGVCSVCWETLPVRGPSRCLRCDETLTASPAPELCGKCLIDPPAFESLRAAAPYAGSARAILHAFKFRGADYLGPRMADRMLERLQDAGVDEVAAVPATWRARRVRGFHPASVLGRAVAARLEVPWASSLLLKTRETEVQSGLAAARRAANVRGAFAVARRPAGRILLVDDVATSGATARECARRLAEAGARCIFVWCFARASRQDLARDAP
jgi:ComF family protein